MANESSISSTEAIDYEQTLEDLANSVVGNHPRQLVAEGRVNSGLNGEDLGEYDVGRNRLFFSPGNEHNTDLLVVTR